MVEYKHNFTKDMGGVSRLVFLFLFFIGGSFIALGFVGFLSFFLFKGDPSQVFNSVNFLKWTQLISVLGLFIFPSIAYAYVFHYKTPFRFLELDQMPKLKTVAWVILLLLVGQAFMHLTAHINAQMVFPDSLKAIEEWMRAKEDEATRIIELFISDKSFLSYLSNIFVIGVLAGIGEELLFRGCIQKIFKKIFKNTHIAIWVTAFIFSAIHLQFYGFIPRLLAGAFLGYIFVWTRSLWYPIIAHAVHNIINIVIAQAAFNTPYYDKMENYDGPILYIAGILSIVFFYTLIFFLKKNKVLLTTDTST